MAKDRRFTEEPGWKQKKGITAWTRHTHTSTFFRLVPTGSNLPCEEEEEPASKPASSPDAASRAWRTFSGPTGGSRSCVHRRPQWKHRNTLGQKAGVGGASTRCPSLPVQMLAPVSIGAPESSLSDTHLSFLKFELLHQTWTIECSCLTPDPPLPPQMAFWALEALSRSGRAHVSANPP